MDLSNDICNSSVIEFKIEVDISIAVGTSKKSRKKESVKNHWFIQWYL